MAVSASRVANQASFAELEARSLAPLRLKLEITDPEIVAELLRYPAGPEREQFAAAAMRLGVMSLRMASGQVDGATVRAAGEQLVSDVRELLASRAQLMTRDLTSALGQYFDPKSGLVTRRLESLLEKDGDLERVLSSHVGGDESSLARTLATHLGEQSPLFKMLSPNQSDGLRAQLEKSVETALRDQRDKILREFSLDHKQSALRRMVDELDGQQAELRTDIKDRVGELVREFSLDRKDSALSRLVTRVEKAQSTITSEFSLDREDSALSRMSRQFQDKLEDILEKVSALQVSREKVERTTESGVVFEDALSTVVTQLAQGKGDVSERTGNRTGAIKNCKVGDFVVELGPDSTAAGARIAWEAKDDRDYTVRSALQEIERARKNRRAQVGVFVFSAATAPEGLDALARYGDDLLVVWDAASPATDVNLRAAYTTAAALALRIREGADHTDEALHHLERATRAVEKQIRYLDDIRKSAGTAISSGEKIRDRAVRMGVDLEKQVEALDQQIAALKTEA